MNILSKLATSIVLSGLLVATGAVYAQGGNSTQAAITSIQKQIQQVSNSIPVQIKHAQGASQASLVQLQKQMQGQIVNLQKQIQQVQDQMTVQVKGVQKEVHELELMR
ncbi:MAG: hypothetical protein COB66_05355 [Coxiella sp. (in: Bacteria)]|nr:MAG: hypothetical protein COB66_05355 [Coxiella sp. (in: g-proteobacteria)]